MSFADYIKSPEGIATIRAALGSGGSPLTQVKTVQQLKAKYASIGVLRNGQVEGFAPGTASPILLTYNEANHTWYSPWEPIFHFMLATGRATAPAAAVGTQVNVSNEQFVYRDFQAYLDAGLTCQMELLSTGQSDTATAFPISKFKAVKYSGTNPANVTSATPADVITSALVTAVAVSTSWTTSDVSVTGTGSHLWAQGAFEVGGAAATITGYFMSVKLRWRT